MTNLLVIIGMALLLLVVVVLKRRLAGGGKAPVAPDRSWEGLALHYGAEDVLASQVFEKMGGKVGRGYAGVGGDERGLLLYHPGHKGARIPWREITLVPGSFMGLPAFRIETEKTSDITIIIPRRYEDRLRAKAGANWPVVSSRAAADEPGVEE